MLIICEFASKQSASVLRNESILPAHYRSLIDNRLITSHDGDAGKSGLEYEK